MRLAGITLVSMFLLALSSDAPRQLNSLSVERSCIADASGFETMPLFSFAPGFPKTLDGVLLEYGETPCLGSCPDYAIALRLSGVEFVGRSDVRAIGTRRASIDPSEFKRFVHLWFEAKMFAMHDDYCSVSCGNNVFIAVADAPNTWISYEDSSYRKRVNECYLSPDMAKPPQQYFDLREQFRAFAKNKDWL